MKQSTTISERKNYLSHAFDQLDAKDQTYLESLTAQLAAIHQTAPATGKKPQNTVQPKQEKGQEA